MEMHLATVWESIADAVAEELALVHGRQARTWQQFDHRASRLAAGLLDLGIDSGSKVGIDLYNCNEFFETFFAALKLGAVPVAVNYRYRERELLQLLDDADVEVVVAHASLAGRVRSIGAELPRLRAIVRVADESDDDARSQPADADYEQLIDGNAPVERRRRSEDDMYLGYTGGTTGTPKGVIYAMGAVTRQSIRTMPMICDLPSATDDAPAVLAQRLREEGRRPVVMPASPLMHSTAFTWASLPALCAGGTIATLPQRRFDPGGVLEGIAGHQATVCAIVGDAFGRPLAESLEAAAKAGVAYDTSSLRVICSAGVAFSADTKQRLLAHIPQVALLDACGSTEGGTYGFSVVRRGDPASTATFTPAPGTIVLGPDGAEVPKGETGLIAAVTFGAGYYKHPEWTAKSFRTIDGEPYVVPGDYGRIEHDGTLTLLGRGGSTINTGGEKVFPEEVEAVLRSFPDVRDAVVAGVPDDRLGEIVVAIVEFADASTTSVDDLIAGAREQLAGYKVPRHFVVATPPRGPNGKVDLDSARRLVADATHTKRPLRKRDRS
jgi:3-oxocholest-4-en-26-oate---CoA ligase